MTQDTKAVVEAICKKSGYDRTRMMDIVLAVQEELGYVSSQAMDIIAKAVSTHRVEVESVVSFYAFLSDRPKGKVVIRLCNDIIDEMHGADRVAAVFEEELGIKVGETTPDGKITLEHTPCIGMCDQAPAAMVNHVVVTDLSSDKARKVVQELKSHMDPEKLVDTHGDGKNADPLVRAMVNNNIRKTGEVVLAPMAPGEAIKKMIGMSPTEVIREVKTARLRGRGGAGFPAGMKWEFTRGASGDRRFVLCNADEGEPGTFKDRVILTECPDLMFEGMTVAGYAIGSDTGIVYLRGEYAYLRPYLENVLTERRNKNLLGNNIMGKEGFNFDIRIQMGAGAYICGEETSLISSCEGLRGDPKNRPPFPAQEGYLASPTVVNNVETLCCAARILEKGAAWFSQFGTTDSPGLKLLSVSGDCKQPGVYEVPFGIKLREVLSMVGAEDAAAVQMGGPSGQLVGPADFDQEVSYEGLATGGSVMVFGPTRDPLKVAEAFMDFFVEESCGYCVPCRVGNVLLKERLEAINNGKGTDSDLAYLQELGESVKLASRCGLGQTSANPVLSTLKNFKALYESKVKPASGHQPTFDINAALGDSNEIIGRQSVIYQK